MALGVEAMSEPDIDMCAIKIQRFVRRHLYFQCYYVQHHSPCSPFLQYTFLCCKELKRDFYSEKSQLNSPDLDYSTESYELFFS